ncbi:MAG: hypothetical protein HQL66_11325 [Magnetococcales bacterium]|nr:hypothetical protein [Magnetococcales bacterium]
MTTPDDPGRISQEGFQLTVCRAPACRLFLWALFSVAAWGLWSLLGREVALPDIPDARFQCLSYTPFRGDQSPFDAGLIVPAENVRADLALLAPHTGCVRTYSTRMGVDAVLPAARQYGLKLLLGIWIGREVKDNKLEIESTLSTAALHPQSVRAIIVGNEVLLRKEQSAQGLIAIIEDVRRQTTLPLTYADVWEFWLKNPEVAAHVDFLTIHILPYWEDQPVAVEGSLQHVDKILSEIQAAFPGKAILIGETGWPSAGRGRETATPGRVNQARFVREFVALTGKKGIPYNLIEAFDQPWKRFQEGTVGGQWGLFSADRQAKFPLTGPVSEHPSWRWLVIAGSLLSALVLAVTWRRPLAGWRWFALAACGHAGVGVVYFYVRQLAHAAITWPDWLFGLAGDAIILLALLLLGIILIAPGSRWATTVPPDLLRTRAWLLGRLPPGMSLDPPERLWGLLRGLTLISAAVMALPLAADGRYREFPIAFFLAPALLLWHHPPAGRQPLEAWLGGMLALCIPLGLAVETLANREALAWNGVLLLLVIPLRRVMLLEWHHLTKRTGEGGNPDSYSTATRASKPPINPTAPPRAL